MRPNPHRHSSRKTITIVLLKKNPDNKAKARIPLPLASTPMVSGIIRIRSRKTHQTLNAILVNRKVIIPISVLRRSQKTSVGLNNLYVGD